MKSLGEIFMDTTVHEILKGAWKIFRVFSPSEIQIETAINDPDPANHSLTKTIEVGLTNKSVSKKPSEKEVEGALSLHRKCNVVDMHCDTLQAFFSDIFPSLTPYRTNENMGDRSTKGHVDIPRMKDGGVDCQVFAVFVSKVSNPPKPLHRALNFVDIFYRECEKNDEITPVVSHESILRAIKSGKIAAMLSLEGGEALEVDVSILRILHKLGVRMMSLTWNHRNHLADGVNEDRTKGGLTNLGVKVIDEMERLGMIVDVSHLSESSFWSLSEITDSPIIASHSNCRFLCDHPRNLTDGQIEGIADKGGVIGVNFYPKFLKKKGKTTVGDVADQIEHIINLVGVDYVGLGSDFDGISSTPIGLDDVSMMPNITLELVLRGYGEEEIRKILGGNFLRVSSRVIG